jgi:hypothetical protein
MVSRLTYSSKYHSGRMALSLDVQFRVTEDFIFTSRPIAHIFLILSCFDRKRTNRRFFTDLENPNHLEFSETLFDPGEF